MQPRDAVQLHAAQSLYDGCQRTVGQFELLDDFGEDAVLVEVFFLRHLHFCIPLAHHADDGAFLLSPLNQCNACLASDEDGRDYAGKKHQVADSQYGHLGRHLKVH